MKIAMYDLEGHLLEVFEVESVVNLENKLGFNSTVITNCLHGRMLSTNKRQFRKYSDKAHIHNKIGDVTEITRTNLKPVHKHYNGIYICSYPSAIIASIKNGTDYTGINKCLKGNHKTAGGFEWEYAS
jgi:hypothetical protein